MGLRQKTIPVSRPERRGEPLQKVRGGRRAGLAAVLLGAALFSLPATGSLAWSESPGGGIVSGGAGDDEVFGSPGVEMLAGGRGDDFIEAKGGNPDYVACGPGHDTASTDAADRAASDCEIVYES